MFDGMAVFEPSLITDGHALGIDAGINFCPVTVPDSQLAA